MVLQSIPHSTRGIIVPAAGSFHAQRFGDGDLNMFDVIAIQQRFKDRIAKPKQKNILYGFLAQIVIDAIDLTFLKVT